MCFGKALFYMFSHILSPEAGVSASVGHLTRHKGPVSILHFQNACLFGDSYNARTSDHYAGYFLQTLKP